MDAVSDANEDDATAAEAEVAAVAATVAAGADKASTDEAGCFRERFGLDRWPVETLTTGTDEGGSVQDDADDGLHSNETKATNSSCHPYRQMKKSKITPYRG